VRVVNVTLIQVVHVVILDDAAHLHVRQHDDFGRIFKALGLDDHLIDRLALEIGDRAIWADGARLDAMHILVPVEKRNLHVGVLAPFFGEDLDADVAVLMIGHIVAVHLAVQNYRRRAWSFRDAGHLQFRGRDGLPFIGIHLHRRAREEIRAATTDEEKQAAILHVVPPGTFVWRQSTTVCEVVGLPHISRASSFEQVLMTC